MILLPFADYRESARALHALDLGPQRVECVKVVQSIIIGRKYVSDDRGLWMWSGWLPALLRFYSAIDIEWRRRGGGANMPPPHALGLQRYDLGEPPWLGDEGFHSSMRAWLRSHRGKLYEKRGWADANLDYLWPVATKKAGEDMTLEKLREKHSEMLQTAIDLGYAVPMELAADFEDAEAGAVACKKLDEAIAAFRRTLAEDGAKSDTEQNTGGSTSGDEPPKVRARKASAAKGAKKPTTPPKAVVDGQPVKEKKVAKKAAAKKAKPAKKAAKKAKGSGTASGIDGSAKIVVVKNENPAREGSARFDRIKRVLASGGKTVESFVKAGGRKATLAKLVTMKVIRLQ